MKGCVWKIRFAGGIHKMAINKEWHMKNKMPKNASFEDRVKWHKDHNKNCSCHPGFPKKLEEEMKSKGVR
jgi:hypothetical protein